MDGDKNTLYVVEYENSDDGRDIYRNYYHAIFDILSNYNDIYVREEGNSATEALERLQEVLRDCGVYSGTVRDDYDKVETFVHLIQSDINDLIKAGYIESFAWTATATEIKD